MKILVAEDEELIRDIFLFSIDIHVNAQIIQAKNGMEAITLLEQNPDVDLVICDYNMPIKNGSEVYKYILEKKLNLKYVSCHGDITNSAHEIFRNNPPFFHIQKPDIIDGIEALFKTLSSKAEQPLDKKKNFIPMPIGLILKIGSCPGDIFINLSSEKNLKVFNKGDIFSIDDYKKYKDKNVLSLFIEEHESKNIITFLEQTLKSLIDFNDNKNLPSENINKIVKINNIISNTVNSYHFSEEVLELTKKSIDNTVKTFKKNDVIQSLLGSVFNNEEGYIAQVSTLAAFISVAIAEELRWNSEITAFKLTMSAFLHDSTLENHGITDYQSMKEIAEGVSKIDFRKIEKYKLHPTEVVNFIKQFKDIPPEIDKIILEHHERPDGSGFPRGVNQQNISPLGGILIVSLDIADYLYENRERITSIKNSDIHSYINKPSYQIGNFRKILNAACNIKLI